MVGYILTGHGQFSTGLKSAVDMIATPQENFEAVPFTEEAAGTYGDTLKAAIAAMIASSTIDNVKVVAGTNLPMLIDLMMARTDSSTTDELVAEAVEVGKEGVATMALEAGADDEDDE